MIDKSVEEKHNAVRILGEKSTLFQHYLVKFSFAIEIFWKVVASCYIV